MVVPKTYNLDTRISFLIPVQHYNTFNEAIEVFETFTEVWASRKDVSTSEALKALEIGSEISVRFVVRYSDNTNRVDTRYRIQHNSKSFDITGKRAIGRNDWFEFDAVARSESTEVFEIASP